MKRTIITLAILGLVASNVATVAALVDARSPTAARPAALVGVCGGQLMAAMNEDDFPAPCQWIERIKTGGTWALVATQANGKVVTVDYDMTRDDCEWLADEYIAANPSAPVVECDDLAYIPAPGAQGEGQP